MLPVSVVLKTSQTPLEADCPGISRTKREVLCTKPKLESHSLYSRADSDKWMCHHTSTAYNLNKYLMRSPVLSVDAQDLGSEDDAVSEDDTDHE